MSARVAILGLLLGATFVHGQESPPIRWVGVNLAGAEFGKDKSPGQYGKDYIYPSSKSLDYYQGHGLVVIRLPFL